MRHRRFSSLIIAILILILIYSGCVEKKSPTAQEFKNLEEELFFIGRDFFEVGAAVGVINNDKLQHAYYFGSKLIDSSVRIDRHTVFEIGSITKTFTTTLLADMVLDGIISLTDTVGNYLPGIQVTMPDSDGVEITFQHLATHTSGIPKEPDNYPQPGDYDPLDPYAAYTKEDIYDYLTNYCKLLSIPGMTYEYSNTGIGLLGHILGLIDGSSYEELVRKKIFEPLGMTNTSFFLTENQQLNLAPGYNSELELVPLYHANDILQGMGFIKSTLNDMFYYLAANIGIIDSPVNEAMQLTHQEFFDVGTVTYTNRAGDYNLSSGLGWHIEETPDGDIFTWHEGWTNGYSAYIGFDKSEQIGVLVLMNMSEPDDISLIGELVLKAALKYPIEI